MISRKEARRILRSLPFWARMYHHAARPWVPMGVKLWLGKKAGYLSMER